MSLSSESLKRTMGLRSKMKCFGFRKKPKHTLSTDESSWMKEEGEYDDHDDSSYNDEARYKNLKNDSEN